MMRIAVDFQDDRLEFEVPESRVVGQWHGPSGLRGEAANSAIAGALENPRDYPPLRQVVVPGDRVAIAFDPLIHDAGAFLRVMIPILESAGVEREGITLIFPADGRAGLPAGIPSGMTIVTHDPDDRTQLAYLSATKEGRRIYLNRHLTDADVVIPVGELGFDPVLGYRGPWSLIFPRLSDQEALKAERATFGSLKAEPAGGANTHPRLAESFEVSWLLGTQFHIGVVPGRDGLVEPIAGLETAVRDQGIASVTRHWNFRADGRAELVVAGVGRPGIPSTLEDLAEAVTTAVKLVNRGGKIVLLSKVRGPLGPALQILTGLEDPREATSALRGHEGDADYVVARQLAQALAWADIFLSSDLGESVTEDLSISPLDRPEHARKLVDKSGSCVFVSHAELTRVIGVA
jgi:hypothetical protein